MPRHIDSPASRWLDRGCPNSSSRAGLALLLLKPASDHATHFVQLTLDEMKLAQADPRSLLYEPPEHPKFLQLQVDLIQVLRLVARVNSADDKLQDVQRDSVDALPERSPR